MGNSISTETKIRNLSQTELTEDDYIRLFSLSRETSSKVWELPKEDMCAIPRCLEMVLDVGDSVTLKTYGYFKSRLGNITILCLGAETENLPDCTACEAHRTQKKVEEMPGGDSSTKEETRNPGVHLYSRCNTTVRYELTYREQTVSLSAMSEYSCWYNGSEKEGPRFVITIKSNNMHGKDQGLAFMAMVHRIRKESGKNPVVYGLYTDGYKFTFMRIDENSKFSKSAEMDWNSKARVEIVSHIRLIYRKILQTIPETQQEEPGVAYGPRFRFTGADLKDGRDVDLDGDTDVEED